MFGSRKTSDEEDASRGGGDGDAAEVRASQAEARAELAERRLRDADEIASGRVAAASQTLMEVREVVAMLHDQLETVTAELAGISTRFEGAIDQDAESRVGPESQDRKADRAEDSNRDTRSQPSDGDGDGANGDPTQGTERQVRAQSQAGGSPLQRATRMAMAGKSRERIARALSEEFGVKDPEPILDEAMGHLAD
jgi:hypothetical protein